jgi:hypothetical protein
MGLGGLNVNTPQPKDLGLNASSWSTVLLETSEGKRLSLASI